MCFLLEQVETPTDAPLTPGSPYLDENISQNSVQLKWNKGKENIKFYELQARVDRSTITNHSYCVSVFFNLGFAQSSLGFVRILKLAPL